MRLSFGTLGREYINQIEMIQYRVVRYIFNDYNLHRNRQADDPVWYLITKIVIVKRIGTGAELNGVWA